MWTLFACSLVIGIGNALNAPAFQASVPLLVHRADLGGAVSLNSVMINGSRVLGPLLAAALIALGVSRPWLFVVNAVTYLFLIAAILLVHIPDVRGQHAEQGWRRLLIGINIARGRPVLARLLLTMCIFSMVCLVYVGLFPSVARRNFDVDVDSASYNLLYTVWGVGACLGALAVGTVLAHIDRRRLIVDGFLLFAVSLAGVRPRALRRRGVPGRVRARLRLLPRRHGADHDLPGEPRRHRAGGRDAAVVHGVRRVDPARQPDLRSGHRRHRGPLGARPRGRRRRRSWRGGATCAGCRRRASWPRGRRSRRRLPDSRQDADEAGDEPFEARRPGWP